MRRQCLDCGSTIGERIAKAVAYAENDGEEPELFDEQALIQYRAQINQYWINQREIRQQMFEQEQEERRRLYREYLDSPRWSRKRERVLKRCRYICEGCMKWPATHIHHLSYDNIGDELLYQLVGLCRNCHEKAHNTKFGDNHEPDDYGVS